MKKTFLLFAVIVLAGCQGSVATKEYSCAPQNIKFDETNNRLLCDNPKSAVGIFCAKGTYREENGIKSCIDSEKVQHVMKPIVLSESEAFAKKQECNKLLPQINKMLKDDDEAMGTFSILGKVFYSVSMNSCLYHYNEFKDGRGETLESWTLKDGYTNEQLNFGMAIQGDTKYRQAYDDFQDELIRYE